MLDEGLPAPDEAHRPRARPSIVVTPRAPTSIASIMQAQTGTPSSQTVQAEQAPRLQAILVPSQSQRTAQGFGQRHPRLKLHDRATPLI